MPNFIIHPDSRRGYQGTDADILAVRFPFRCELQMSGKPMKDHEAFANSEKTDLVIAEVKRGLCDLNGPWTNPQKKNMQRVLFAVGAFTKTEIDEVADSVYSTNYYEDERFVLRLFAVGARLNDSLREKTVQITWDKDILPFIHHRFFTYRDYKQNHHQWDYVGRCLFKYASENRAYESFAEIVKEWIDLD